MVESEHRYQVGVIGAGWIAKAHMGNLQQTGRADICWIAALNPENLEKVRADFGVPNKTHDYHDILKDPKVDVVLITTPPHLHKEMFIDCVKAGKHVLLEKPMALDMDEIDEMLKVKEQHPEVIAMECSGRHSRLTPKFRAVKEIIDSGALGEVYSIHHSSVARQNRPGIEFHPVAKWFLDKSLAGGGPLFDWGVYDLSFHLGVLGDKHELEKVESAVLKGGLDSVDPGTDVYDVEEHLMVHMKFSNKLSYYWERAAHANTESPNETRISGTLGGIKLAYCTWDDPVVIFYDLDEKGKAREKRIELDYKGQEDGLALTEHLIRVLDGKEDAAISLGIAKKHMNIIYKCREVADNSL
jgi:predicted dehydrogenase